MTAQCCFGIPILGHASMGLETPRDNEPFARSEIYLRFMDETTFSTWGGILQPQKLLYKDIPLCDFSIIKSTLEKEINSGHIRQVFGIELGYVLYNTLGDIRQKGGDWYKTVEFYAVPAWVMSCRHVNNPKDESHNYVQSSTAGREAIEYSFTRNALLPKQHRRP
ncbi:MAG: hypothetical protein PHI98_09150 [Eubacteriales bacterium]|nr:hypothetical protein [Eubacteriales bacterium]